MSDERQSLPDASRAARMKRAGGMALAALRSGGERALRLVYPPSCVACGKATADPHGLCAACWGGLGLIAAPVCERLGSPLPVDHGGPLLSLAAMADPPVFARARSACRYDDTARALITRLKFGGSHRAGPRHGAADGAGRARAS